MYSILVWIVYGLFVGSIAKMLVPGDERFGFIQTIALGIAGSYIGGASLYLLGQYSTIVPAGIFMGIVGSIISLIVYNKLNENA